MASLRAVDYRIRETMIALFQSMSAALGTEGNLGACVAFLSTSACEGASKLVRQLAIVSARHLNKSVLLLDANTGKSTQAKVFGLTPSRGWRESVRGDVEIEETYSQVENLPLYVSQIDGRADGEGVEISEDLGHVEEFFEAMKKKFNLVLIDAPAAEVSAEGVGLSRQADGVILVVEANKTRWQVAQGLKERISRQGGRVLGAVLNKRRHPIPKLLYRII